MLTITIPDDWSFTDPQEITFKEKLYTCDECGEEKPKYHMAQSRLYYGIVCDECIEDSEFEDHIWENL